MGTGVSDDDKKKSTDSYPPDHVARRHVGWPHAPARCSPPLGQFFCCVVWLGDHTGVDSVQHRVCLYIQDPPVWSVNESRAHVNFVNTKFQIERDRLAWTTICLILSTVVTADALLASIWGIRSPVHQPEILNPDPNVFNVLPLAFDVYPLCIFVFPFAFRSWYPCLQ